MMAIFFQKAQSIRNYATQNSFGAGQPNWELIPHRGMGCPDKSELTEQIKQLVIQMDEGVKANNKGKIDAVHLQVEKLRAQYISAVSPDRKSLYRNVVQKISGKKEQSFHSSTPKTLLDFLNEKPEERKIKNMDTYSLPGGSVTAIANSCGSFDFRIRAGGEEVMTIDNTYHKVLWSATTQEAKRIEEFSFIYQQAERAVRKNNSFPNDSILSSIDVKA